MDVFEVQQVATAQLDGGEKLLWSGSPRPSQAALSVLPATLMGVPFLGFACFWVTMALHGVSRMPRTAGPWFLFPLFGLPFVLVGLGMLLSPLWAWLLARRTVYAVTDKRVLIIGGAFGRNVQSFTAVELGDFTRSERADGSGTLWFGWRAAPTRNMTPGRARIGFVGVADVRTVEQLIRDHVLPHAA